MAPPQPSMSPEPSRSARTTSDGGGGGGEMARGSPTGTGRGESGPRGWNRAPPGEFPPPRYRTPSPNPPMTTPAPPAGGRTTRAPSERWYLPLAPGEAPTCSAGTYRVPPSPAKPPRPPAAPGVPAENVASGALNRSAF